jgi:hypothetical protein
VKAAARRAGAGGGAEARGEGMRAERRSDASERGRGECPFRARVNGRPAARVARALVKMRGRTSGPCWWCEGVGGRGRGQEGRKCVRALRSDFPPHISYSRSPRAPSHRRAACRSHSGPAGAAPPAPTPKHRTNHPPTHPPHPLSHLRDERTARARRRRRLRRRQQRPVHLDRRRQEGHPHQDRGEWGPARRKWGVCTSRRVILSHPALFSFFSLRPLAPARRT